MAETVNPEALFAADLPGAATEWAFLLDLWRVSRVLPAGDFIWEGLPELVS
ncbi:hypothetical protein [Variovorax paradoxus]|uniref:hypothetical protein n=1 Tax=Variovorax paradoxus TaxID=34073 RepID=UPI0027D86031|nr:hypothetical protein [Variovorax paradoxus]